MVMFHSFLYVYQVGYDIMWKDCGYAGGDSIHTGGFRAVGDRQNRAMVSTYVGLVESNDLDDFGYPYVRKPMGNLHK